MYSSILSSFLSVAGVFSDYTQITNENAEIGQENKKQSGAPRKLKTQAQLVSLLNSLSNGAILARHTGRRPVKADDSCAKGEN
jgi:hypothetical protein